MLFSHYWDWVIGLIPGFRCQPFSRFQFFAGGSGLNAGGLALVGESQARAAAERPVSDFAEIRSGG